MVSTARSLPPAAVGLPGLDQVAQLLLLAAIPVALSLLFGRAWTSSDGVPLLSRTEKYLLAGVVVLGSLAGVAVLRGWLPIVDVVSVSAPVLALEALLRLAIPVGLSLLVGRRWLGAEDKPLFSRRQKYLLAAAVVALPLLVIAWLNGWLPSLSLSLLAQGLLVAAMLLAIYLIVTLRFPLGADGAKPLSGWPKFIALAAAILVPWFGILWLRGGIGAVLAGLTEPTLARWIQLMAAVAIPVARHFTLVGTRTLTWPDLLMGIGMMLFPALILLQLQGVIPITATLAAAGFGIGHAMEMLDSD
ncbi:MAG: hypothetical protein ABEJ42_04885 [Halobacteriaceae archaeon]